MKRTWWIPFFISTICLGQVGPGGVGTSSNNVVWLKADAGTSSAVNGNPISAWNDQSGNGFVFSAPTTPQQPLFQTSVLNGFPAILFDGANTSGQNDKLICPDSPLHDNTNGYSFFTVSKPLNIGTSVLISKRVGVDNQESFMLFYYTANKLYVDIETSNNRFYTNYVFANGGSYITDVVYDGTLPTGQRCKTYLGETFDKYSMESSGTVPDNASQTTIGSTDPGDPRPFDGYIAEVVVYRQALNKASRIIVNNYLSAKYNIPLTTNDYYAGDTPANGNYDYEVAGIGTDTVQPSGISGSNSVFAASASGGLGISQVSGFDPGDYVLAGHSAGTNTAINTDVNGFSGSDKCRWSRIWYIDVTNSNTPVSVDIEFDMSDGGVSPVIASPSNYVLLYRSGLSGNWTALTTASGISGDKVLFDGYTLTLDGYYTIGSTVCAVSPLPVEMLSYSAAYDQEVRLTWETASEARCGNFEIARSADGADFTVIGEEACGGGANEGQMYTYNDPFHESGTFYYRLRSYDEDGVISWSGIRSVQIENLHPFQLIPNPAKFSVKVLYSDDEPHSMTIYDEQGKTVNRYVVLGELEIDLTEWTAGVYFVQDDTGNRLRLIRI